MKKPFSETTFGKILGKAVGVFEEVAPIAANAAVNPAGALFSLTGLLKGKQATDPRAAELLHEIELQRMEIEAEMEMKALEIDAQLADAEQRDKESARRSLKDQLAANTWVAKHFVYILATFIVCSASFFGFALLYVEVPPANQRLVDMFADVFLFAGAITVIQFFFGGAFRNPNKSKTS